ncbi:hypothetical protein RhiLY_01480 [Ceratobasidium sp. AG-Ba]|nr:hypothetical protein RhiLY_01480 [Ceratobasidium sp. AG-Ba]
MHRNYPWGYPKAFMLISPTLVLVSLTYFNLAVNEEQGVPYNIGHREFLPDTKVGNFPFAIGDIHDLHTGKHVASVPYSGETLRRCHPKTVTFTVDFHTYEFHTRIYPIICYIDGGLSIFVDKATTAPLTIPDWWGTFRNLSDRPTARILLRIQHIYSQSVTDNVLKKNLTAFDNNGSKDHVSSFYARYQVHNYSVISFDKGNIFFERSPPLILSKASGNKSEDFICDPSVFTAVSNNLRIPISRMVRSSIKRSLEFDADEYPSFGRGYSPF